MDNRPQISLENLDETMVSEVTVRQPLNDHWTCRIVTRNTIDLRPAVEGMIGKPLTVSIFTLLGEHVVFSGIVREATLSYEVYGSFGVRVEAISHSWLLDAGGHKAYFKKTSAQDVAGTLLGNNGLALTGTIPPTAQMTYVQWDETDFSFLHRLVDDAEAWMRPAAAQPGVEVQTAFQEGTTVQWCEEWTGLVEWHVVGRSTPLQQSGDHYDSLPMQSTGYTGVTSDTPMTGSAADMVSATRQSGSALPPSSVPDSHRAITLDGRRSQLELESRRALASSVLANGVSRNALVRSGDKLTVVGLPGVDGDYGVIDCVHHWTPEGYRNHFTVAVAQRWFATRKPERPRVDGLFPARVVVNYDPHNQGRIQVKYWWQTGSQTTWVRLLSTNAGADRGFLVLPEIGDEVSIAFEEGDAERPYIVGSVWNGVQQPPSEGYWSPGETNGTEFAANDIKRIVTKSGIRITLVDKPGQETITLASPNSTRLTLTEKANETGRPAIVLESQGDILFSAPSGRIHFRSATGSRQVGS